MGYNGVLGLLADEQLCGRLDIAPAAVLGTSEPLTADIRARIRAAWGCDPANAYATTEALLVANSTPAAPGRARDPRRRADRRGRRRRQPPGGAGRGRREGPDHEPRELHAAADPLRARRSRDARRRPEPDRPPVLVAERDRGPHERHAAAPRARRRPRRRAARTGSASRSRACPTCASSRSTGTARRCSRASSCAPAAPPIPSPASCRARSATPAPPRSRSPSSPVAELQREPGPAAKLKLIRAT